MRLPQVTISEIPPEVLKADAHRFPPIPSSHKPNVDRVFLRQLRAILRIAFPSLASRETAIVLLHSFFLVARTVLSVGVARLDAFGGPATQVKTTSKVIGLDNAGRYSTCIKKDSQFTRNTVLTKVSPFTVIYAFC